MKNHVAIISSLIIIASISVVTAFSQQKGQTTALPNYVEKIYPSIVMISDGPRIYHESFLKRPYLPNPEGEYSFFFRMVVAQAEIWDRLYLEKISAFDEEGIDRRVTKGMYLLLDDIFPDADFREQRNIESITWLDSVTVDLKINREMYRIKVSDFIPFTIYKGEDK